MRIQLASRQALRWTLRKAAGAARRAARTLERAEASLTTEQLVAIEQRGRWQLALREHDMVDHPDEAYYRDRYWEWIQRELDRRDVDLSKLFLDAGCGSGRLTIPLARKVEPHGGEVIAVDLVPEAVDAAREATESAGLANVAFEAADQLDFLKARPSESFAATLFLEVAYVVSDLESVTQHLQRTLRPGGLLLASFRPRYYLAMTGVAHRRWDLAKTVLSSSSGYLPALGLGWQNWHSAAAQSPCFNRLASRRSNSRRSANSRE